MSDLAAENYLDHVLWSDVETALNKADDPETVAAWLRERAAEIEEGEF